MHFLWCSGMFFSNIGTIFPYFSFADLRNIISPDFFHDFPVKIPFLKYDNLSNFGIRSIGRNFYINEADGVRIGCWFVLLFFANKFFKNRSIKSTISYKIYSSTDFYYLYDPFGMVLNADIIRFLQIHLSHFTGTFCLTSSLLI